MPAPVSAPTAPAPAAPPAQAPKSSAPPSAPTPPPDDVSWDAGIDADLAALDDAPKPPVKAPAKPAAEKPPEKPAVKPEEKVSDTKPQDKLEDGKPPVKAADLRGHYEALKKKVREEYEPKLSSLEAKVREHESKQPENAAALVEEIKTIRQRRDELESEIKFVSYEKSAEFQESYQKPYREAWTKAIADLSELTIDDGEGNVRQANPNDLAMLANMKLGEARVKAREMFGEAADDIMIHRKIIRDLSDKQTKALEDAKKNAGEREKAEQTNRQIQHQEKIRLWKEHNEQLAKKYPNWFGEVEGDSEGNSLLKKGFALADLHFTGAVNPEAVDMLPPKFRDAIKARGHLTVQEGVALDALLRNKIASHSRLALHLKASRERIKELEATIAEYEKSEPPGGSGGDRTGGDGRSANMMADAEAELDALDKRS